MYSITEKQEEVIIYIRNYIEAHDRSPTMDEIGKRFAITPSTAWQHVNTLVKKGLILVQRKKARSIFIRDPKYKPDLRLESKIRRKALQDESFANYILELADELKRARSVSDSSGNSSNRD